MSKFINKIIEINDETEKQKNSVGRADACLSQPTTYFCLAQWRYHSHADLLRRK